mmetsp:Transcript_23217/g.35143  ORF Transcript_23217/g.35143 Transcript_23217/m.35143 type:complete len:216 (+) Transcript_23217:176-823(+)
MLVALGRDWFDFGSCRGLAVSYSYESTKRNDNDNDNDVDLKATKKTKVLKSILKRTTSKVPSSSSQNPSNSDNNSLHSNDNNSTTTTKRRSLFPQNSKKPLSTKQKTNTHSVSFSPMARVQTVKSREEMSLFEKSQIWWQKNDYDDFKTTGRLIAKAAATGGSEVWLASNNQMNDSTTTSSSSSSSSRSRRLSRNLSGRCSLPWQFSGAAHESVQ